MTISKTDVTMSYLSFVLHTLFSFQGANLLQTPPHGNVVSEVVGANGLEPSTSRLSGGRSNLLSYKPMFLEAVSWLVSFLPFGGDNRDRTDDPLLAKQVLSQLSYTPVFHYHGFPFFYFKRFTNEPQKLNNEKT